MGERNRGYTFGKENSLNPYSSAPEPKERVPLAETIKHDFCEERPMWPFTSYAPHGKDMTTVGHDKSFEELRYEESRLIKVENVSREAVIARTNALLEETRRSLQQYYDANCQPHGFKACKQMHLLRRTGTGDNAGFGSASQYRGPYGTGAVSSDRSQQTFRNNAFGMSGEQQPMSQSVCGDAFTPQNRESMPITTFPVQQQVAPTPCVMETRHSTDAPPRAGDVDDKDNPWLAQEFTYIPDSAPPERYIH